MPRIDRLSPAAAAHSLAAAGQQLKAWWSAERDKSVDPPGLYGKLSLFSFIVFCLNVLFLLGLYLVVNYQPLAVGEGSPAELLTAVLFGVSSLTLFLAAGAAGRGWLRLLYILAGLGALFIAGEELSWGQHILGFANPNFLEGTNAQRETNLHNNYALLGISYFLYSAVPTLLYVVTIAAFILGKYRLGALPLPSLWLAFFFALSLNLDDGLSLTEIAGLAGRHLLLILGIFLGAALLSRDKRLLLVVLAVITLSGAAFYLRDQFSQYRWLVAYGELGEYLLSLAVFLYSLQLLRDSGGARWLAWSRRIKAHWFRPGGRAAELLPPLDQYESRRQPGRGWGYHSWRWAWPAASLAVVLSSIGLVLFDRQLTAGLEREYRELTTGPPTAQSGLWRIYHTSGQLTYIENAVCPRLDNPLITPDDHRFFLHIIPIHQNDLPLAARAPGFQNRNFKYPEEIERFLSADERCMATIELPNYPIAQIHTGQMVRQSSNAGSRSRWRQLWKVSLDLDADYYRAAYQPIAAGRAGPPLTPAEFDLYRYNNALYYFKESCAPADTADRFFLHIVPLRVDDLPAERQPFRFSNRDFDFNRRGHWFDGKCLAIVPLPDYPIAEIRTGQQVDGMPAWATRVNFAGEYYRDTYRSIRDATPAARAVFDLYRQDNILYYLKESCVAADTDARFFLHLIPDNPEDLPAAERDLGFANRDFDFDRQGQRFDRKCVAVAELPDYPIAEIRTGQFTPSGPVWEVALPAEN